MAEGLAPSRAIGSGPRCLKSEHFIDPVQLDYYIQPMGGYMCVGGLMKVSEDVGRVWTCVFVPTSAAVVGRSKTMQKPQFVRELN